MTEKILIILKIQVINNQQIIINDNINLFIYSIDKIDRDHDLYSNESEKVKNKYFK